MGEQPARRKAEVRVLVVEDEVGLRFAMCGVLRAQGFVVIEADSCAAALSALQNRPDVIVTDLCLPDGDALELLPRVHGMDETIPILVVTGHGTIDLAVRAVKSGAENFLTKPLDLEKLAKIVRAAAARRSASASGMRRRIVPVVPSFLPRSPAMQRVEEQVEPLRDVDCTVLLLGETGTGKSVLARRIHAIGKRGGAPFVDINCAGLTREFVESELFGHERGAFTGAHSAKVGLLDEADGGTLFLDEIGDIDASVQPKLLKVLEEKRFRRLGDVRERSVDVRLVAATHHDLLKSVSDGRFRADLYYRVSTVSITLPSLRERPEDIVPLAEHMLSLTPSAASTELSSDAKQALLAHRWPGNLRELKNVIARARVQRRDDVIHAGDLRFDAPRRRSTVPPSRVATAAAQSSTLAEMEREHIRTALQAERGHVEAAARRLGIPRSTLYQRIKAYGLEPSKHRPRNRTSEPPDGSSL